MRRAVAAVAVACLGACGESRERGPGAGRAPQPTPVVRRDLSAVAAEAAGFVGVIVPRDAYDVLSPLSTKVNGLLVALGAPVVQGTPVAVLDDREPRDRLALARTELRAAEAAAREAVIGRDAAAAKLAREQAAERAGISSGAEVAAAAAEAAKAVTTVERAAAEAATRREAVKQLEQRLADTTLRAPIDGRVALRYVEPGARVVEGQAVLRIIRSDALFVRFAIPAGAAASLAAGDPVEVRVADRGTVARATIAQLAPQLDPVAQMIIAEADLDPAATAAAARGALRAGDTVRVVALAR